MPARGACVHCIALHSIAYKDLRALLKMLTPEAARLMESAEVEGLFGAGLWREALLSPTAAGVTPGCPGCTRRLAFPYSASGAYCGGA